MAECTEEEAVEDDDDDDDDEEEDVDDAANGGVSSLALGLSSGVAAATGIIAAVFAAFLSV